MPKAHQRYANMTPADPIKMAARIGGNAAILVERMMRARPHPEQGYRSAMRIIALARRYERDRLRRHHIAGVLERPQSGVGCRERGFDTERLQALDHLGADSTIDPHSAEGKASKVPHLFAACPIASLQRRSGGFKHHMPPSRFAPSPTFGNSSCTVPASGAVPVTFTSDAVLELTCTR
jgi:hypothetical protein